MLAGTTINGATATRQRSAAMITNRRAGHTLTIIACVRARSLPARYADIRLRVIHRGADGSRSRALVTPAGRLV